MIVRVNVENGVPMMVKLVDISNRIDEAAVVSERLYLRYGAVAPCSQVTMR